MAIPTRSLSELCELISGQHIDAADYSNTPNGTAYLTGPSDFGSLHPIISKWTHVPKRTALKGDILLTVKGSGVGSINMLDADEVAISRQLMAIRPTGIDCKYLYTFLSLQQSRFRNLANGAAIPGISRPDVLSLQCPVPPLPEQKRIVAIIDEAFEGIDRAIANTKQNLANATELFKTLHTHKLEPKGDWQTVAIGDHVKFIDYRGKTPPKRATGIRLITAKNVKMGYIQRNPEEFIDTAAYDGWMTRGYPRRGDVLFTTEAPLGNIAQLDTDETVVIGQRLITMQPDQSVITGDFLKHRLMSSQTQKKIWSYATGATVQGIKAQLLKTITIEFPPLPKQIEIADTLDELGERTNSITVAQKQKLAFFAELKKSVLARAFSGELTATAELQDAAE